MLNYKKSCYILVNKQPQITINENFKININDNPIIRTNSIKYLSYLFILYTLQKVKSRGIWWASDQNIAKVPPLCDCNDHLWGSSLECICWCDS